MVYIGLKRKNSSYFKKQYWKNAGAGSRLK